MPYVDASAVHNAEDGTLTLFIVNRHPSETIALDIALQGFEAARIIEHKVMTHADLEAVNSPEKPEEVAPRDGQGASVEGGTVSLQLPAYSYQVIRLKA